MVLERESGIGGFRERKIGKGEDSQKIDKGEEESQK